MMAALAAVWLTATIGVRVQAQQAPPRLAPEMDPARAERLYVSTDPSDHSTGYDFTRDVDRKAVVDRRYARCHERRRRPTGK